MTNVIYFIVIIKKIPLSNGNSLITHPITEMGVTDIFGQGLVQHSNKNTIILVFCNSYWPSINNIGPFFPFYDPPPSPCHFYVFFSLIILKRDVVSEALKGGFFQSLSKNASCMSFYLYFQAEEYEQCFKWRNSSKKNILWQFSSDFKAFGALKTTLVSF